MTNASPYLIYKNKRVRLLEWICMYNILNLSLSLYNAVMCAFMAENSIGSIRNGRFSILTKIKGEEKRFV